MKLRNGRTECRISPSLLRPAGLLAKALCSSLMAITPFRQSLSCHDGSPCAGLPREVAATGGDGGRPARRRGPGGQARCQGRQGHPLHAQVCQRVRGMGVHARRSPSTPCLLWLWLDGHWVLLGSSRTEEPPGCRCRDELVGVPSILRYVGRVAQSKDALYGSDPLSACQVGTTLQTGRQCSSSR